MFERVMTDRGVDVNEVHKWLFVIWLLAAGPLIVAALPISALEPLRRLIFPVLRRGKLLRSSESAGTGFQKFTLPQSFFTHFYALGVFWNSLLLFTCSAFAVTCSRPNSVEHDVSSTGRHLSRSARSMLSGDDAVGDFGQYGLEAWRLVVLLVLLETHLTRRLYECLFVSSFDSSARMNLLGYFGGLGYYVMVPLTVFLQSFHNDGFVSAFKGFLTQKLRGRPIPIGEGPEFVDVVLFLLEIGWFAYIGAGIFLFGSFHQHSCHEILAQLRPRPRGEEKSGKTYGIPQGDWFESVSCAHYLAEIVIYAGLLIATGATNAAMWMLFLGVVANLYLMAKPTHEWYLSKFEDYPKQRNALFPYISCG